MKTSNKALALLSVALITASAEDNKPTGQEKTFLACPIVRDTKTVPCWLAENQGETYYLGIQADQAAAFQPPQLLHKVLVEGSVQPGERICGGVVIKPIRISVMPEIDYSCNLMLPAVDEYTVPFAVRGPGPNNPAPGRGGIRRPVQAEPQPPFTVREFTLYYDFDAERAGRMARVITEAMTYAKAAHAKKVQIQGYRAAVRLSDGANLEEYPWIAQHRAEIMAETLRDLGIPASTISSAWTNEADMGAGSDAYQKRRLTITVTPE